VVITKRQFREILEMALWPAGTLGAMTLSQKVKKMISLRTWSLLAQFHQEQEAKFLDLDDLAETFMLEETCVKVGHLEDRVSAELKVIRASQQQILRSLQFLEKAALVRIQPEPEPEPEPAPEHYRS